MGDVFHVFPALTDLQAAMPDVVLDWVVEKTFSEIPSWHPFVNRVLPIEQRKWRKSPFKQQTRKEVSDFYAKLNQESYDLIIDAQGLYKALLISRRVPKTPVAGLDWHSVREPLASFFYDKKYFVDKNQHAITRLRSLFSQALGYQWSVDSPIDHGLNTQEWLPLLTDDHPYVVLFHGTTWETKYWPEPSWRELITRFHEAGLKTILCWGNDEEQQRSLRLVDGMPGEQTFVPENKLSLNEVARLIKYANAVISVDTGLSHVAAALDRPMVVLYRVTNPKLVGAAGPSVKHLASPLAPDYIKKFSSIEEEEKSLDGLGVNDVWRELLPLMK